LTAVIPHLMRNPEVPREMDSCFRRNDREAKINSKGYKVGGSYYVATKR
jgi:hypothetical protein